MWCNGLYIQKPGILANTHMAAHDSLVLTTPACLDGVIDPMALLTAIDFVNDCAVALAAFEEEKERTGTPETS